MPVDDSYTKALLHMEGADGAIVFTDESGKTWSRGGDAQIDTAQYKFGSSSLLVDGTGDYIDTPDDADFEFGSGDFTIDCWVRLSASASLWYVVGKGIDVNSAPFALGRDFSTNVFRGYVYSGSGLILATGTTVISNGVWYHLALVRYGNGLKIYVNGTSEGAGGNVTGVTIPDTATKVAIGRCGEVDNYYMNGWVDEVRISKGIARWTADFSVPTYPYGLNPYVKHLYHRGHNRLDLTKISRP